MQFLALLRFFRSSNLGKFKEEKIKIKTEIIKSPKIYKKSENIKRKKKFWNQKSKNLKSKEDKVSGFFFRISSIRGPG